MHCFGRLVVVICMVRKCVLVLTVCMGRFGSYSACGWVCNGGGDFTSWLEWCLIVWMGCRMGGR